MIMGLFGFLKTADINAGVRDYLSTPGAMLLDVRTPEEYADGHVEGSVNLPLQQIEQAAQLITEKGTPLFVYCRSGGRSAQATARLVKMGYTKVTDIGGILSYRGKVVKV